MWKKIIVFFALSVALTGCFEAGSEDPATLTTPVTNNPRHLSNFAQDTQYQKVEESNRQKKEVKELVQKAKTH